MGNDFFFHLDTKMNMLFTCYCLRINVLVSSKALECVNSI